MNDKKSFDKIADLTNKIYDDGAKESVSQLGKTASYLPRAINAALAPFEKWLLHREYSVKETKKLLEAKLQKVPEDDIVSPEPYIAAPALDAITYCMDNEILRDMFANLLAKSMISDSKDSVHPSFVEIIKQLSPLDAKHLSVFESKSYLPIAKYMIFDEKEHEIGVLYSNIIDTEVKPISALAAQGSSMTNLERLGLISIDYERSVIREKANRGFEALRLVLNQKAETFVSKSNKQAVGVRMNEGITLTTPFGEHFIQICL